MTLDDVKEAVRRLREEVDDEQRLEACRTIILLGDSESLRIMHEVRRSAPRSRFSHSMEALLAEQGFVIDLAPYVVENWFDSMYRKIQGFEEVCDVVGYRFMAFSLIIGVNLKAVLHNPEFPSDSTVEFVIGNEKSVQEAKIEDFRRMLIMSLMSKDPTLEKVTCPPNRDDLAKLIGVRYLLLAPLYKVSPRRLFVMDQTQGAEGYSIEFEYEGEVQEWSLGRFREFLRDFVSAEQVRETASRGKFSGDDTRSAEKALAAGNPEKALEHLRDWILFVRNYRLSGSVTQLLREPEETFAKGLLLTGRAYRLMGRRRLSEDLLRFSIQLIPGGSYIPRFFFELGLIMMEDGRHGEAVAPLRRSLELGLPHERVYPYLGEALLRCNRVVGAAIALGELNREGLLAADGAKLLEEIRHRLGPSRRILEQLGT